MSFYYYFSLVISPAVAGIMFYYLKKYYDKERFRLLTRAFILGALSIFIPLIFQYLAKTYGYTDLRNLKRIVFYSFILIGFFSELGKYLVLRYYVYPYKDFDGPSDGIIFATMIAMGYASVENILYVFSYIDYGNMNPILAHAYTAAPANIFFAIVMGFFMGMAKLGHSSFLNSLGGFAAAAFFHGLYDFCLITRDYKLLSVFAFGFMILVILLLWKTARGKIEDKRTEINHL